MPAETTITRLRRRTPRGRSDDALVARVRGGDDRAFELVYDRYAAGLLAFCAHMLGSRHEAEDAVQHALMSAYAALREGDGPIRLKPWLYTIARNRCLSMLRARREHVAFDELRAPTDTLADEIDRRAEVRGLLGDLARLPDDQRAALVLFELGDHAHDEIAEVLGVRREKVKALVFQARESLAGWRQARDTPCAEIREQLATARGAALKRTTLRRHVERCAGCREFEREVRRQRAALAATLPMVPSAAFKATVLSSIFGGGGGAAAGVGVAGLGAAKGLAAKTLLCAVVAGGAGSAGYVAVHDIQRPQHPAKEALAAKPRQARAATHAAAAQALVPAKVTAATAVAASTTSSPTSRPHSGRHVARRSRTHAARHETSAPRGHAWGQKRKSSAPKAKHMRLALPPGQAKKAVRAQRAKVVPKGVGVQRNGTLKPRGSSSKPVKQGGAPAKQGGGSGKHAGWAGGSGKHRG